jgi:hypothetical protein
VACQQINTANQTSQFNVFTKDRTSFLGTVKWFGRWRCYSFFPSADTVFEQQCLNDIADFLETLKIERKNAKDK